MDEDDVTRNFTTAEAQKISRSIGVQLSKKGIEQFRQGLKVELEHGTYGKKFGLNTNVTNDDLQKTGKIALIHINEVPSYYTGLKKMEKEGKVKREKSAIIKKHLKH